MHTVVLGNAENRRVDFFCNAVRRLQWPEAQIISYADLLSGRKSLSRLLTPQTLLRIESPGENFGVERELIALGAEHNEASMSQYIPAVEAQRLTEDRGCIRYLRQWYLGYKNLLSRIEADILEGGCRVLNSPAAIQVMFDKISCQHHLQLNNLSIPRVIGQPYSYDALRSMMSQTFVNRVFIKPSHSSSAAGVIAYRTQGPREKIITSMAVARSGGHTKFYNALRINQYTDSATIQQCINFILKEGAIVEEWIPKASLQNNFFDVRIVVINGAAMFVLPRLSKGPITNLHLGNARGDMDMLRNHLGEALYVEMIQSAERAVQSISGAFYAGVDIMIPAGLSKPRILELNAFGDLLPGLTHSGNDTYTAQLKAYNYAA